MKIFLSYGHDSNEPLIEKIKEVFSKNEEENLKHKVWMDKSEIKAGKDWRTTRMPPYLFWPIIDYKQWHLIIN